MSVLPTNPKGSCKARGGEQVRERFVKELALAGAKAEVRANKSGCLDACDHGVACVVYPEGIWYARVSEEDVPEIVRHHIIGGRPVERLLMAGQAPLELVPLVLKA